MRRYRPYKMDSIDLQIQKESSLMMNRPSLPQDGRVPYILENRRTTHTSTHTPHPYAHTQHATGLGLSITRYLLHAPCLPAKPLFPPPSATLAVQIWHGALRQVACGCGCGWCRRRRCVAATHGPSFPSHCLMECRRLSSKA